jgi:hypothetical protein
MRCLAAEFHGGAACSIFSSFRVAQPCFLFYTADSIALRLIKAAQQEKQG